MANFVCARIGSSCVPFRASKGVQISSSSLGNWQDSERGVSWKCEEIAKAVGGILVKDGSEGSIHSDSRSIHHGEWFLPLTGTMFDGHEFLPQALAKGCAGALGRSIPENWPVGFVQVNDGLEALHKLAMCVRNRYTGPVVGITGSCGKTTTRAMTALALEWFGHVHQTKGNQNNNVGLPLTLLGMPSFSSACVLELGMNHSGEILELSQIAQPSVRVILNVGPAHIGNFNSLHDVAAAKAEIFADAREDDICIVNADDPLVMGSSVREGMKLIRFGRSHASDVRLEHAETVRGGQAVNVTLYHASSRVQFEILSPGLHLAENACAAAAVGVALGIPLEAIATSLARFSPMKKRCELELIGNSEIQLVDDSYNANPMSMVAALKLLKSLNCRGRKIALLGDMLELGTVTANAHMDILKYCQAVHVDIIGVAGSAFIDAVKCFQKDGVSGVCYEVLMGQDAASLADKVVERISAGDAVLVKGSRGMRMELVVDAIKARFPT